MTASTSPRAVTGAFEFKTPLFLNAMDKSWNTLKKGNSVPCNRIATMFIADSDGFPHANQQYLLYDQKTEHKIRPICSMNA